MDSTEEFVHRPYELPNMLAEPRVFCSSRAIPKLSDEEIMDFFGPLGKYIESITRPRGKGREFVHVSFREAGAAAWLVAQHPMVLRNTRLNIASAKPMAV
jgi:hypothetical protein